MKKVVSTLCYLCGKPLAPPTNADHPVMQQLFAPEIRRKFNVSQLITLDVHQACNTAYIASTLARGMLTLKAGWLFLSRRKTSPKHARHPGRRPSGGAKARPTPH